MLHLEHLNLVVKDIPATVKFYQAAFPHWQVRGGGEAKWYGKTRNWVHFGDTYQYLTFNDEGEGESREREGHQLGVSHFAFVTENMQTLITRMKEAGYPISTEGAHESFKSNIYYIDPNGFEVEFVQYHSDNPADRNTYDS